MFPDELGGEDVMLAPHGNITAITLDSDDIEIKEDRASSSGNGMTGLEITHLIRSPAGIAFSPFIFIGCALADKSGQDFPGFLFETRQSGQAFSFLPSSFWS